MTTSSACPKINRPVTALILSLSLCLSLAPTLVQTQDQNQQLDYGVDVSYPMHYDKVSNNYAWLPHNQDRSLPVPPQYKGMVVQPLGDRQAVYDHMIQGCVDYYGDKGVRCLEYEKDRVEMTLRQPKSMEVRTEGRCKH